MAAGGKGAGDGRGWGFLPAALRGALLKALLASPRKTPPYLPLEDALHQLPLVGGAGVGGAALEQGDIGFPFGLAGESGEA